MELAKGFEPPTSNIYPSRSFYSTFAGCQHILDFSDGMQPLVVGVNRFELCLAESKSAVLTITLYAIDYILSDLSKHEGQSESYHL